MTNAQKRKIGDEWIKNSEATNKGFDDMLMAEAQAWADALGPQQHNIRNFMESFQGEQIEILKTFGCDKTCPYYATNPFAFRAAEAIKVCHCPSPVHIEATTSLAASPTVACQYNPTSAKVQCSAVSLAESPLEDLEAGFHLDKYSITIISIFAF
mmetsp:Transcript_40462/g.61717  ORF Transcript_40462/g.61717 Transcript_40462/m.61717 type:complete len:155 (+) Transcript_40462:404-868(+)